jgi:hypothetical protein
LDSFITKGIQQGYGTTVVVLRYPFVPDIMGQKAHEVSPAVKLKCHHMIYSVLMRRKHNQNIIFRSFFHSFLKVHVRKSKSFVCVKDVLQMNNKTIPMVITSRMKNLICIFTETTWHTLTQLVNKHGGEENNASLAFVDNVFVLFFCIFFVNILQVRLIFTTCPSPLWARIPTGTSRRISRRLWGPCTGVSLAEMILIRW